MKSIMKSVLIVLGIVVFVFTVLAESNYAVLYSKSMLYFRTKCQDINDETLCNSLGCYWWDGACNSYPAVPSVCKFYINLDDIMLCVNDDGNLKVMVVGEDLSITVIG